MLHDLSIYVVGRLLLAALLGGAVGLERELRRKPAGIRANMLICAVRRFIPLFPTKWPAT